MDNRPDYEVEIMTTSSAQSTSVRTEAGPERPSTRKVISEPTDVARKFWTDFEISRSEEFRSHGSMTVRAASARPTSSTAAATAVEKLVDLPTEIRRAEERRVSFHPLQEWEGYVTRLKRETFTARLTDLTANSTLADQEGDFPIDDVEEDDRELLGIGRVFRWAIGYLLLDETKYRVSHISFRRLRWTEEDLAKAEEEGRELASKIRWE